MSDRHAVAAPSLPLWRRLRRWLRSSEGTARAHSMGLDSARMDLGYEAAYAPTSAEQSSAPSSRFEEDRPVN